MAKMIKTASWLSAVVLLVACCGGKVYGLAPFGTAAFCALSGEFFIGFVSPIYILCQFLFTFDVWRLYTGGAVVFIMAVRWFLGLKFKRFGGPTAKILCSLFAVTVETVLLALFMPIADAVITGFTGCVFYYFSRNVAVCARNAFAAKPGAVESASLCAVFLVMGMAFGRAEYEIFVIGLVPAMFSVLLLSAVGTPAALACGGMSALGVGMNCGAEFVPALFVCTLTAVGFSRLPRPLCSTAAIGMFAAAAVLFYAEPIFVAWNTLMLAAGAFLYCIIPKRAIKKIRDYFDFDGSSRLALRHYINRTRADAGNRMLAVSSVFDETARLMNVLTPKPPDYAAVGLAMSDKICPYCANRDKCDKQKSAAAFTELAESAGSGKSAIAELPAFFTESCSRTMDVIAAGASVTDSARTALKERECESKAKAVITERMVAVKDVLEELGKNQALPVGFDGAAERKIIDELNTVGVECAEAFCTRDRVIAIVRTGSAYRDRIQKAVGACLKRECEICALEKTQAAGWSVVTLKKRPKYEAVYARAGIAKEGVSGDSYTFKRIGDKFLTALFDGMGSGERAGENSGAAVDLIECFYKAGFDPGSVVAGVNRFLKLPDTENYSAADVTVCDLDTADVDIIKIGSPPCFIKTADTVLKIEGNSLPMGVLDEMRPFVTTKRLYPGQMLMLVTDGISDCFSGDELPEFINGLSAFNPEAAVTAVVERALKLSGGTPKDDMTAIAFRLFEKRKGKLRTR